MSFPGLDVVFRLAASAVEVLVEGTAAAVAEVGDDEAGIGAVAAGLDAGDDAADPAPVVGDVEEFLEAAHLPSPGIALKRAEVLSSRPPTVCWSERGRGPSRHHSPRTSRGPADRRSGCRRAAGPAASWRGSRRPGAGERRGSRRPSAA